MKTHELPRCDCGCQVGLSTREGKTRCPDCLWDRIEWLQEIVNLIPKVDGKPVVPHVDPEDGTAERLGVVFRYEAAKDEIWKGCQTGRLITKGEKE